jgi:hypothetical protein
MSDQAAGNPSTDGQGSASFSIDLGRYADQLERQRNAALNEAAQWRAAAEELAAERDQLKTELAALKE